MIQGRDLLRAFVLLAAIDGHKRQATMENVREMIEQEVDQPGTVFQKLHAIGIPEVSEIANIANKARGCWFRDALLFLKMNVTTDHMPYTWHVDADAKCDILIA